MPKKKDDVLQELITCMDKACEILHGKPHYRGHYAIAMRLKQLGCEKPKFSAHEAIGLARSIGSAAIVSATPENPTNRPLNKGKDKTGKKEVQDKKKTIKKSDKVRTLDRITSALAAILDYHPEHSDKSLGTKLVQNVMNCRNKFKPDDPRWIIKTNGKIVQRKANDINDFDFCLTCGVPDALLATLMVEKIKTPLNKLLSDSLDELVKKGTNGQTLNLFRATKMEVQNGKICPVQLINDQASGEDILNALKQLNFWKVGPSTSVNTIDTVKAFYAANKRTWPPPPANLTYKLLDLENVPKEKVLSMRGEEDFMEYINTLTLALKTQNSEGSSNA